LQNICQEKPKLRCHLYSKVGMSISNLSAELEELLKLLQHASAIQWRVQALLLLLSQMVKSKLLDQWIGSQQDNMLMLDAFSHNNRCQI
jgi:hypothetical protein